MTVTLNYWGRVSYTSISSKIKKEVEIKGETEIEVFEQFYELNNSLRYCNGSYYTFKDVDWENKYKSWLESDDYKAKSFELYYGKNGIVD